MTIPDHQTWLTAKQVGEAFGHDANWVYDQIAKGKSNRAGTNGIPARMVRKVGGSIHVHRSFVFPEERSPSRSELTALQVLPPPPYPHLSDKQIVDLGCAIFMQICEALKQCDMNQLKPAPTLPSMAERRAS